MVEFVLVFLLFVMVLMGMMEFGRGMWTYTTLAHATRQTARYCMVRGSLDPTTLTEIRAVAVKHAVGLEAAKITLAGTWDGGADPAAVERGDTIRISLSYPFSVGHRTDSDYRQHADDEQHDGNFGVELRRHETPNPWTKDAATPCPRC